MEHPILFSTPMVQAILNGNKTMTRRVIKPQPAEDLQFAYGFITGSTEPKNVGQFCWTVGEICDGRTHLAKCPYGQPGDRLWVRETWQTINSQWIYKAGYYPNAIDMVSWKPSIHMPRVASRILLEVVSIRVERVQDITEGDCIAEGIEKGKTYYLGEPHKIKGTPKCYNTARESFAGLWDLINAKRGYGWEVNPWVWVVEFKKI